MNKRVICVVSNGYSEEMMATNLMLNIQEELAKNNINDQFQFIGGSLVSSGKWFQDAKFPIFFAGGMTPSGGFPTKSISGFLSDLEAGAFLTPFKMASSLKNWTRYHLELIIIVGDVLLLMTAIPALRKKKIPLVFIPTAKSDYIQSHFKIEKKLIRKYATVAFPRDSITAYDFKKDHINVLECGNMIQDLLNDQAQPIKSRLPIVGLFPGSRDEAYGNLEMMLQFISQISVPIYWALAKADSVSLAKIQEVFAFYKWTCTNIKGTIPVWEKDGKKVYCYPGAMFDNIALSCELAVSLAGTAGEQIAGLGKPVIGFKGTGPQSTHKRMLDNAKLLGKSFIYVHKFKHVASTITQLLENPKEREELGKIGTAHMGKKGATKCISKYIVKYIIQNPAR